MIKRIYLPSCALFTFLTGAAFGSSTHAAEGQSCTAKKFGFAQVETACKTGGRAAAKDLMKQAVKTAKSQGQDMKCNTCHVDLKDFALKPGAGDKLAPLL